MTFQVSFIYLNTDTKYLVMGIAKEVLRQGCANRREAVIHSFLYKHNSFKDFIHPYPTYTHFYLHKQDFHQYHQTEIKQNKLLCTQCRRRKPKLSSWTSPSRSQCLKVKRYTRLLLYKCATTLTDPSLSHTNSKMMSEGLAGESKYWSHSAADSGSMLFQLITKTQSANSMSWSILLVAPLPVEGIS